MSSSYLETALYHFTPAVDHQLIISISIEAVLTLFKWSEASDKDKPIILSKQNIVCPYNPPFYRHA